MLKLRSVSTAPIRIVTLIIALLCIGKAFALPPPDRLPLQKTGKKLKSPGPVPEKIARYDEQGNPVYYDPKPRAVSLGDGKFALKWIGSHGKELTVFYQRPDAIDLVVEAITFPVSDRRVGYKYRVRSLTSSKQALEGFAIQNFSSTVNPYSDSIIFAGNMSGKAKEFQEGDWILFAPFRSQKTVGPGQEIVFELSSPDPPGLVECRARGRIELKGFGGEVPEAIIEVLPKHEAWPHGYTIGPDERLAKLSLPERLKYLVERLPEMLRLGWIADRAVMNWYQENLNAGKAAEVRTRAQSDFKKNLITSEVLALMTHLTQ